MKKTTGKSSSKTTLKAVASKRRAAVRVKATHKRSESSRQWLQRHLNDPYVAAAKEAGYRSRAAYKLLQMDEQYKFLRPGMRVVDLGAAPGGWSQVVAQKIGRQGRLVALDILPIEPIKGAVILQMDFLADDAPEKLKEALKGQADMVLSDLAPSTTGHAKTDHIRIMGMAEMAVQFASEVLAPDGIFVCKFFQGGGAQDLLNLLKKDYAKVRHAKPPASRSDSSETFIVAQGFRGGKKLSL